jgi:predicted 2-oxoglutarate/Fe(II)-dependent dioxygenase YbiX
MRFEAPRIGVCRGFASAAECDWLMARARPRLGAAQVYDPHTGAGVRVESSRTNSDVNFNMVESDLVLVMLRARIAAVMGASVTNLEPAMVLHYAPGQYFAPHWDGLDPDVPGMAADIAAKGQRTATFLLYLNDDYDGGDTDFPDMNWRFRGGVGDALFFWNTDPAGRIDRKTRHAGIPTQRGEKWLLSQWIRGPAGLAI